MEKMTLLTLLDELRDYPRFVSSLQEMRDATIGPLQAEVSALHEEESSEIERLKEQIPVYVNAVERSKKDIERNVLATMETAAKERFRAVYDRYGAASSLAHSDYAPVDMEGLKIRLREALEDLHEAKEVALPALLAQRDKDDEEGARQIAMLSEECDTLLAEKKERLTAAIAAMGSRGVASYDAAYVPKSAKGVPEAIAVGHFSLRAEGPLGDLCSGSSLVLPYELSLSSETSFAVLAEKGNLKGEKSIEGLTVALTLRILESFPSGQLEVAIVSGEFSLYSRLLALHHALFDHGLSMVENPCDTGKEISALLTKIAAKGAQISRKLSEKGKESLTELSEAERSKEPHHLIVLHRCLAEMDEKARQRLASCVADYGRCGFLFLFVENQLPEDILSSTVALSFSGGVAYDNDLPVYLPGLDYSMDEMEIYEFLQQYVKGGESA